MKFGALLLLVVASLATLTAIVLEPRGRCRREHGFALPADASHIECGGNAWLGFGDRGAVIAFDVTRTGFTRLEPSLHVTSSHPASAREFRSDWSAASDAPWIGEPWCMPSNAQYSIGWRPRGRMRPLQMLRCASTTGDGLCVEVWERPDSSLSVRCFTDWN
jgi:hypothetical protein